MTEGQLRTAKAAVDLAYSVIVVGIVAYMMRGELRKAWDAQRTEIDARRMKITRRARELRNRGAYALSIRETLIDEEMNAVETLDETLPVFGMES